MTDFKTVNNADAGTATKHGGNDVDRYSQIFNGVADVAAFLDFNTQIRIRSGRLELRNAANSFSYSIVGAALAANRTLNLPLLSGTDTLAVLNEPQTFTNKTIDFSLNTVTNIPSSALPISIAYEDQANIFSVAQKFDLQSDLKAITAPASPSAGYASLFFDSSDSKTKVKKSDGTVVDLETAGAPGSTDEKVIVREAGVAVGASARKLNFPVSTDFDLREDVANDEIEIQIANGAIFNAHLAGGIAYSKLVLTSQIQDADLAGSISAGKLAGGITDSQLNQITDKAKLPSSVLYGDQNNVLGAFYEDISEIATPANPATGTRRLFVNNATGKLSVRTFDGGTVSLEEQGGGAGGAGGGGMAAGGIITKSGDATTTQFLIPHGLIPTPEIFWAEPASPDSFGHYERDIDGTNIIITYAAPPPSGTGNLVFNWAAGYLNAAAGGFTPSSATEMTNKIVGNWLDWKEIATPAAPAANVGRMFFDTADEHIKVRKSDGSVADLELGTGGGGGGTGGGGMSAGGIASLSGNASQTVFNIPHGLSPTPEIFWAEPASSDAFGSFERDITGTNIVLTYSVPPPSGSSNLVFNWAAGYVNEAGGFTPSSTTILTNKTIGDQLDFTRLLSAPADPPANTGRLYTKRIDDNNDGLFWKGKKAGAIVEVRIL